MLTVTIVFCWSKSIAICFVGWDILLTHLEETIPALTLCFVYEPSGTPLDRSRIYLFVQRKNVGVLIATMCGYGRVLH